MWEELLIDSGLNDREVRSILVLGSNPKMKASELQRIRNHKIRCLQQSFSTSRNGDSYRYCGQANAFLKYECAPSN